MDKLLQTNIQTESQHNIDMEIEHEHEWKTVKKNPTTNSRTARQNIKTISRISRQISYNYQDLFHMFHSFHTIF